MKNKSSCDWRFEFQVKFRGLIRILHYLFRNYSNFLCIVLHVQRLESPWIINLTKNQEHSWLYRCRGLQSRDAFINVNPGWRWKPLVTLRNWNNRLGKVWRRGDTAHDLKQTTSSVKHGGGNIMAQACTTVSGAGSLLIMWLLIEATRWIVRYTELYSLLRFSQML